MKKNTYVAPELWEVQISVESGFVASDPQPWYLQGGQGDFTYGVEVDDEWA